MSETGIGPGVVHTTTREGDEYACSCGLRWGIAEEDPHGYGPGVVSHPDHKQAQRDMNQQARNLVGNAATGCQTPSAVLAAMRAQLVSVDRLSMMNGHVRIDLSDDRHFDIKIAGEVPAQGLADVLRRLADDIEREFG